MNELDRLRAQYSALHGQAQAVGDYSRYRGKPLQFVIEILKRNPLVWQRTFLLRFHDGTTQSTLLSCTGGGKTELIGWLLLYEALAWNATTLYFTAAEKQHRPGVWKVIRRCVAHLGLKVYKYGLRLAGGGEVLFSTRGDVSSMRGVHDADLLIASDESQSLTIEEISALQSNAVGERNFLILAGNATSKEVGCAFQKVTQSADPSWHRVLVTAYDVVDDPAWAPGMVTRKAINDKRQLVGEDSDEFRSLILAQWPKQASGAIYREDWLRFAFDRFQDEEFATAQRQRRFAVGIDFAASEKGDFTVVSLAWGKRLIQQIAWREPDLMTTVAKIEEILVLNNVARDMSLVVDREYPGCSFAAPELPQHYDRWSAATTMRRVDASLWGDEGGLGIGGVSRLRERGWPIRGFNASKTPEEEGEDGARHLNMKAWLYDRMRSLLATRQVALVYSPELEQEILAARGGLNGAGKLQITSKEEMRKVLGRSPDFMESAWLALAAEGAMDFTLPPGLNYKTVSL